MTELHLALIQRFGEEKVKEISISDGEMPLLLIVPETRSQVTVVMTNGLSSYKMPVPEKLGGREFNELYFCLPSYWEWNDFDNPNMNWIYPWIQRLTKFVIEKQTWFGPGHTMPCGADMESLSPLMRQNHFFLSEPLLLKDELSPLKLGEKTVHFLAIIPIFPDEMDFKQGKGTFKFLQKLSTHGITEKLDDFRNTILRSKWRMIKK